jgi:hypothetical protein
MTAHAGNLVERESGAARERVVGDVAVLELAVLVVAVRMYV